ncbi:sushi, von Willebrand factor type A, EGF and pentraxin domain-containing protein 1-like [Ylistrum balloti]|uniref:sushi, von Willebrand factor type A, EGF and pentraxin domain-containing protein 1-like n=1 Tax=Ylistrum balloti TaxID=509963 RepID=UPI002905DF5F|nr:sushi, von Willebrand factor type A, EGF and pentraxin domain-containing protein 1-like [Ylistrum balloti]
MPLKISLLMFHILPVINGIQLDVPKFQSNFYLSSVGYKSISEIGLYECARCCGLESGCQSFTCSTTHLRCRLIEDDSSTAPGKFHANPGFIYGNRTTVVLNEALMGPCYDHDCPNYTSCVRLSSTSRICIITACGPPPFIMYDSNDDDVSQTMIPVGVLRYLPCPSGTTGYRYATCLANGQWSEPVSHCSDCGNPPNISNAIVSAGNTTIGSNRIYHCSPATNTSGSGFITCRPNITWSEPSLVCIPDCVIITNMQNAYTTATVAPAGITIQYTCDTGYEWQSGTGGRLCNANGVWENLDITCSQDNGMSIQYAPP